MWNMKKQDNEDFFPLNRLKIKIWIKKHLNMNENNQDQKSYL